MNVDSHVGLFSIPGFPTFQSRVLGLFYSRRAAHFIHVLSDAVAMLRLQVSVFSVFISTDY